MLDADSGGGGGGGGGVWGVVLPVFTRRGSYAMVVGEDYGMRLRGHTMRPLIRVVSI